MMSTPMHVCLGFHCMPVCPYSLHSTSLVPAWRRWCGFHDQDLRWSQEERRVPIPLQPRLQERGPQGAAVPRVPQDGGEGPQRVSTPLQLVAVSFSPGIIGHHYARESLTAAQMFRAFAREGKSGTH